METKSTFNQDVTMSHDKDSLSILSWLYAWKNKRLFILITGIVIRESSGLKISILKFSDSHHRIVPWDCYIKYKMWSQHVAKADNLTAKGTPGRSGEDLGIW